MPIISNRIRYQQIFADGKIVNIGCGENPAGFGPDTMQVDMDVYTYPLFTQADAHHLPFEDDEFDTAILGDILEHSADPVQMLREAGRVAKKIVATVFEEWRLNDGGTKEQIEKLHKDEKNLGFTSHYDYLKSLPDFKDKIVSVTDDSEVSHHPHLQMFTEEMLCQHIDDAGLAIIIKHKYPEGEAEGHTYYNWLFVCKKK